MKVLFIPFYSKNPYQNNLADALKNKGVEIKTLPYVAGKLFPILSSVLANWKPDIIHLHWTDRLLFAKNSSMTILKSLRFIFELCVLKIIGIKLVWTVHNLFNHEKRYQVLEKYFHRILCIGFYDKIIAMSACSVDAIMEAYQLPARLNKKISIVPHGHYINNYRNKISKSQARDKLGISDEKTVFLYFGIILQYKGVFHLINEFVKIKNKNTVLLICGKPLTSSLEYKLRRCCNKNKQIKDYLKFVPDQEIETYMNAADVVVLPFQEILNSGSVILAMSFAKAIISPSMGCLPELIDKNGGFLYNPNKKLGLIDSLNKALKSDLISMGQKNFNKIISIKWDMIAQKTYDIYKQC